MAKFSSYYFGKSWFSTCKCKKMAKIMLSLKNRYFVLAKSNR